MKGTLTIYRRELAGLFVAPLAWILLTIALTLSGWLFVGVLVQSNGDIVMATRFVAGEGLPYWALMMFLPPLLTMRMISEESKNGLLEFLLTSPVSDTAVVAGKFLAALSFMGLFWSSNLIYAFALTGLGSPPDWPPVLGAFLGALLVSGLFCAIGLFASSLTSTPILAAFGAMVGSLLVLLLPNLVGLLEWPWLTEEVEAVDVMAHYSRSFLVGVIDTKSVVFFLAGTALFLFLASRAVEAKRWR